MKVMKFGGSSVADAVNITKVAEIVAKAARDDRCIVVLSAMQGTTDMLIDMGRTAERGDDGYIESLQEIEQRHRTAARILLGDNCDASEFIDAALIELASITEGVRRVRDLSPKTLDRILSFGEIASTKIFSAKLDAMGLSSEWVDSRRVIKTDPTYGKAIVDQEQTNLLIAEKVASTDAEVIVLPGFIASDAEGFTTTLGRGGSDYTAAIAAAAVGADVLEIWTDVGGMMTADPRIVRGVRHIPRINYREAMELSHFGAKVIYPPTIQPVMARGIPLWIRNTFEPDSPGTMIEPNAEDDADIIRGISTIDGISVLNLEGSGMVGVPGFSRRLFDVLARSQINVILITQSSSEHSICVAIEERYARMAKEAVDREFEAEIKVGKIDPLKVENGYSILALVGDNMRSHTGVSGKMFSALGQNGINIHAIAQGSSERNISAIISSADVRKAVNVLHEEFFSDGSKQVNVFIAGVGTVGKRLIGQIRQQRDEILEKLRLNLRVVALAGSRRMVFDEEGVNLDEWRERLDSGEDRGEAEGRLLSTIVSRNLRNSVFVDVTASPDVVAIYPDLLKKSVSIVACNKIACSSAFADYESLKAMAREYNANFLFETNVGAGLPVINTLNDLVRSGDRIRRIEAVLSGTLNFVFNNYDGSRPFADVVRLAQDEGYTEPDPRLDLSGTDVARKILILAREAGQKMELSEITNESFLPPSCLKGTVEHFYRELGLNEAHFRSLLDKAAAAGLKLKYIARLDSGRASVGLQMIGPDHDFARLAGKDNAVLFYTDRYSEQPLVVKGAGAGADVTAAGVFADIIRSARN